MKFTTVLSLGAAQLALGKSVHRVAPVRREPSPQVGALINGVQASAIQLAELQTLFGLSAGSGLSGINFLWVNVGGGAATTIINQVQTVTVTQGSNGAVGTIGAAVPPVNLPGQVQASPTQAVGASPVTPGLAQTHDVIVGGPAGLQFTPPQLVANVGDTVVFTFRSQNHTVTQSGFETPCDPLAGGMDSGFQQNPDNSVNPPPQVAMQVTVATPLWFYCRQNNHCGKGMVFSINPTTDKTHAMFQSMAIQQRGQGGQSAIVGGPPAAPVAGAPPAAAPPAAAPVAAQPAAGTVPDAALASGVVTGAGTIGPNGECQCAVVCQFDQNSQFPGQAQGAGAFGGIPGGVPMAAVAGTAPAGVAPVRR